ncbi:MAG: LamG domain-containing protein, partial [Victivallaceae bacterium]
ASGENTVAQRKNQITIGKYNILDTTGADGSAQGQYMIIGGNGASGALSNAFAIDWMGRMISSGVSYVEDAALWNNSYCLYLDSGALKYKHKDNSGTVTINTVGGGSTYTAGTGIDITDGVISATGGASELAVETLGTSGTQTINRSTSDKWTITPTAAVTLATSNFTDLQKATLKIIDGGTNISWPAEWIWDKPSIIDVTSYFDNMNYAYVPIAVMGSLIPTLKPYGYDLFELTGVNYQNVIKIHAKHIGSFADGNRYTPSLLMHMNGTDGGVVFTDSSANNFTITAVGNVTTITSEKKMGSASLNFPSETGDYLTTPSNAVFNFGSGDWSIQMWVWNNTASMTGMLIGDASGGNSICFGIWESDRLSIGLSSNGYSWDMIDPNASSSIGTITVTRNAWSHVAVVRFGGKVMTFVNGVKDREINVGGSVANTSGLSIGRCEAAGRQNFRGHMDELIITKGASISMGNNFTPSEIER